MRKFKINDVSVLESRGRTNFGAYEEMTRLEVREMFEEIAKDIFRSDKYEYDIEIIVKREKKESDE